jgi:hypothetical protein
MQKQWQKTKKSISQLPKSANIRLECKCLSGIINVAYLFRSSVTTSYKIFTTFITNPAFIMSAVVIDDAPKTMALGAVATGSMKAYELVSTLQNLFFFVTDGGKIS